MKAMAIIMVLSMVLLSTAVFAGDDANQAARTEVSGTDHVNSPLSRGPKSEVPGLMNFQGTLTDGAGVALDTTVSMIFSIYDDSTGGSTKWSETQPAVVVSSGIFNVLLGRVNSIQDTVFTDPVRWLGVQVGGDPEMAPRQRIAAVGYAFRASEADTADYARSGGGGGGWVDDGTVVRLETDTDSVGIGTTTPMAKLDVSGDINADSVYMIDEWTVLSTKGEYNTMVGANAGLENTGSSCTFVGRTSGMNNQGNNNTFVGRHTGPNNSIGHSNTFLGSYAGNGNTSGGSNTFVGFEAGLLNTDGTENIFIGKEAGRYNESHFNTFIGVRAGYNNTTGTNNTFLGHMAGRGNGTGYGNTFLGVEAGWTNTDGYLNTFVGEDAGNSNTIGDRNTFLGMAAGLNNTEANDNTFLGFGAGYNITTGSGNVFIGSKAGQFETGSTSNKLIIAKGADSTNVLIYGDFATDKVGLGTVSPSERLHVAGNAMIDSTAEMAGFKMQTGAADGAILTSDASGVGTWQSVGGMIPTGGIIMWSGTVASSPAGWQLCDGTNGTPDLRDRFILCVADGQDPGDTGGSHNYGLTASQLPGHHHTFTTNSAGNHTHGATCSIDGSHHHYLTSNNIWVVGDVIGDADGDPQFADQQTLQFTDYAGNHSHTIGIDSGGIHSHTGTTDDTGSGDTIDNRPAYYTLAFIMKL